MDANGLKSMYSSNMKSSNSFKPSYRDEEDEEDEEDGDTIDYGRSLKDLASTYRMM